MTKNIRDKYPSSLKPSGANNGGGSLVIKTDRLVLREFGSNMKGNDFAKLHPFLAQEIRKNSVDALMSDDYPHRAELSLVIRALPEFSAFLKTTARHDFFFAAFGQSSQDEGPHNPAKTGSADVERFIIERIKSQYETPRVNYEFVAVSRQGEGIAGYAELFDRKQYDGGIQCERGVFIRPELHSKGYGKEAIIAVTDFAFKNLDMTRIFTMVDPENVRSRQNIEQNSGGIQVGETESKYAHLNGGGKKRCLYHIYPDAFYDAVQARGHSHFLAQDGKHKAMPPAPTYRNK